MAIACMDPRSFIVGIIVPLIISVYNGDALKNTYPNASIIVKTNVANNASSFLTVIYNRQWNKKINAKKLFSQINHRIAK